MNERIKILIVDDHPIFRQGLRQVVESDDRLRVTGEAGDGASALALIEELKPAVVVADVNMPQMGGLELARKIKDRRLPVALVFLTMDKDAGLFNSAMDAGVAGYVLKDSAATDITDCIKAVAAGRRYVTPALSDYLFSRSRKNIHFQEQTDGLDSLTKTERRILCLIAEDKTSREIGEMLFIHSRTVDNHRTNICQKLDIHGSHALLRFALKHHSELCD